MSVLIIAEKPSVANNIAKALKATTKMESYWQSNGYLGYKILPIHSEEIQI